jgi:TolB-like protein/class 3 adenylate cyclase
MMKIRRPKDCRGPDKNINDKTYISGMTSTRQLAAIMFTDMVGYTAMMQENEQLAIQRRKRNQQIFDDAIQTHQGNLLQSYGDGTLTLFSSAVNAIRSAIEMQTQCRQEKIALRIGIHIGDVLTDEKGIYGDGVNVASRIESLAVPGSIFISDKLYDDIKNHEGISAKSMGYFELKNVKQPMQVYAISNEDIVVPTRDEVKGKVKQAINSIAVLPFVSLSSDPENEFFCDGITEELLNVLAKIESLQVTSRTSSFAFKAKSEDIREIGAKLNVQKLLEGSVRKSGNRVRITAQLINAADGYHIWSETYERSLEDIFAVQDDIAREIANKFRINLSETEHGRPLVKAPTENMEAYKKYLEGIYLWNTQLPENLEPAILALRTATQLDTAFTAPYSYIAFAYFFLYYSGMMPQKEARRLLKEASDAAIHRDPENDQSLLAHGISCLAEFQWDECYTALRRSVEMNPNSTLAWISLASYYALILETEKAFECLTKARVIDPIGPFTIGSLVEFRTIYGNYEEAIAIADDYFSVNPDNPYVRVFRQMSYGFMGHWQPTIEWLEEGRKTFGEFPHGLFMLGIGYCRTGQFHKAEALVEDLKQMEAAQPELTLDQIGGLYANLLQKEAFFERMKISLDNHSAGIIWFYKTQFYPEEISQDERFKECRRKIGLPV